jgi:hypothetical protein
VQLAHRVRDVVHYPFPLGSVAIEHCRCDAWRARVSYGVQGLCLCTEWSADCSGEL